MSRSRRRHHDAPAPAPLDSCCGRRAAHRHTHLLIPCSVMPPTVTVDSRPSGSTSWPRWLCLAALLAGTCDICFATGFSYFRSGVPPSRVLQFVASGAIGPDAYTGGTTAAAIGLGFHYLFALIF